MGYGACPKLRQGWRSGIAPSVPLRMVAGTAAWISKGRWCCTGAVYALEVDSGGLLGAAVLVWGRVHSAGTECAGGLRPKCCWFKRSTSAIIASWATKATAVIAQ